MNKRNQDIIDLLNLAQERGLHIVGLMDNYPDMEEPDNQSMQAKVTYKYGVPVCNTVVPTRLFYQLEGKAQSNTLTTDLSGTSLIPYNEFEGTKYVELDWLVKHLNKDTNE